jgi:integrase
METTRSPGIFKRGNGYVGVVSYRDGFARKRQKWLPPEPTLTSAKDARRRLLNELERGLRPDGSRMSVAEFSEVWLADVESRLRPATLVAYRSAMKSHILPALGGIKLRDVNRSHLRKLYGALTPSTGSACHAALSAMFAFAVRDEGVLQVNPAATVRRPSYAAPEARHLDPGESRRLLAVSAGTPIEPAILLGLAGGLRIGEVVAACWGDLEGDAFIVRRSASGKTKSGKVRSVVLPASAAAALRRVRKSQAESLLSIGVRQDAKTPVVADPLGRRLSTSALRRSFAAFCNEHGFDLTFHSLRHSNAIALLSAGVDVRTVAGRLGHQDGGALLLRTYGHFVRSTDEAAAARLEGVLGG